MKYFLRPSFISPTLAMEITEEEYTQLHISKVTLDAAFSLEENYDLLIGNYLELEQSSLSLASSSLVRVHREYHEVFEFTAEMNRRAVNFLTTAKLFSDQLKHRFKHCGGDESELLKRFSLEYDKAFEYRFMEALRNHVQHSGSAVHSLTIGSEWKPAHKTGNRFHSLGVYTFKRFLEIDKSFKKSILSECPEEIDFLASTRIYLSALSEIHGYARESIKYTIDKAQKTFENAIQRYESSTGASALALAAYTANSSNNKNPVSILLDWEKVRQKQMMRNRILKNLGLSVVSSAIPLTPDPNNESDAQV